MGVSMQLDNITYVGPGFETENPILSKLPDNLVKLLQQVNGFIQFHGGLHVRGVCTQPQWHSISYVMKGKYALHKFYKAINTSDVPFAQDCVADQFILREKRIYRLYSETGEIEFCCNSLSEFFDLIQQSPVEFLRMQPLLQYQQNGGVLQPGQVLHVYPPFCTEQSKLGVSLRAVSIQEALAYLTKLSKSIASLKDGQDLEIYSID
jgi:hypothetical protein